MISPDHAIDAGIVHFNARRFFEAHESWEELWLATPGPEREFLQGLIQLAAAYHHVRRGTAGPGAIRLFESALRRLHSFPEGHLGIDRNAAVAAASLDRERLLRGDPVEDFPTLSRR